MKTHYDRLAKICTNSSGHMTKMANMPMYGKTFNSFISKIKRSMDLVSSIGDDGCNSFAQMMSLG